MLSPAHYQTLEYKCIEILLNNYVKNSKQVLNILDFGCGCGKFTDLFLLMNQNVVAVDININYIADAKNKGVEAFLPDDFFLCSNKKFDIIFLSHVIEHLVPDQLVKLISSLIKKLAPNGHLILISPTPGERFYHDFSHVRPYMPQSIRHAFGQIGAPISFGENKLIELIDIYFFKDPYRTRLWRSFYVGGFLKVKSTIILNKIFDFLWKYSNGHVGVTSSWLGIYKKIN